MTRQELSLLIDKVIGSKGIMRASVWWVKRLLNKMLDYCEGLTPKIKVESEVNDSANPVQSKAVKEYVDPVVNDINSTIGDINSTIGDINSTIGDINSTIGDINSTIGDINSTIGDINSTIGDINSTIGDINSTLDYINGEDI